MFDRSALEVEVVEVTVEVVSYNPSTARREQSIDDRTNDEQTEEENRAATEVNLRAVTEVNKVATEVSKVEEVVTANLNKVVVSSLVYLRFLLP